MSACSMATTASPGICRASPSLGISAIELMPLGQFPGERNWGYDGVLPFAPQNTYGPPSSCVHWSTRPTAWG